MKKLLVIAAALLVASATAALATPSTQIWIPSTDVQKFKTGHLGVVNYVRADREDDGSRAPNVYDLGLTAGVLPFEKVQAEVGIDYIVNGTSYDNYPLYFNAKVATPEE